jgi:hypothetical protein
MQANEAVLLLHFLREEAWMTAAGNRENDLAIGFERRIEH